ncbi:MAG: hypothetical protein ABIE75_05505 [Candidatus Omnitrophota bacterium]
MRPSKKPKYKLDPNKFTPTFKKKKEKFDEEDLYKEMLRSKTRLGRR